MLARDGRGGGDVVAPFMSEDMSAREPEIVENVLVVLAANGS